AQSFQGTFTGEGVMMTLQPSRDRFYGTLVFDDEFYSIEAAEEDGELTGSFVTAKGEFDFRATFRGNLLELETNSVTYVLRRAGQGAGDEPEPAVAAEPAADEHPTSGGTLTSMSFEEGTLPAPKVGKSDGREGPRPVGTDAGSHGFQPVDAVAVEPVAVEPVAVEPVAAAPVAAAPADEALVGTWQRGTIAADAGTLLADVTALELTAGGTFVAAGASGDGHWKTEDRTLYLRSTGAEEWQPYCRYKVVVDTLLCTVDEDSRQLWFRH
ncbi:MAG: hypothetical protein V3T72_20835, partial [Thermoanaerobaculia bacterium]